MAPRSKRGRISIHAPLAGCDRLRCARAKMDDISIHAPLAGCDSTTGSTSIARILFQSTHPLRGATDDSDWYAICWNISIHAPLAGCDREHDRETKWLIKFQSTHPLRGATIRAKTGTGRPRFQSTHPLRGATSDSMQKTTEDRISIHAPLAGCDQKDFISISNVTKFQSTHPLRGATSLPLNSIENLKFQSTHPLRGATDRHTEPTEILRDFNPRTPCGVRLSFNQMPLQLEEFQSTHPLRGATRRNLGLIKLVNISIHAPLAGCDSVPRIARRAPGYFNPRTPCGVRQQNCRNIPGKFAQKLQNFCKAEQRAALPRVGQRESGCYFRPCAVRTSRRKPERFRFASDNERALRSVARLCAEVLDAGFILVSKVIKA